MQSPQPDPVSRRQAREILANPGRWGDRPSLIQLARMIAASAEGLVVTQRRLAEGHRRLVALPKVQVVSGGAFNETPHGDLVTCRATPNLVGRPIHGAPAGWRLIDGGRA